MALVVSGSTHCSVKNEQLGCARLVKNSYQALFIRLKDVLFPILMVVVVVVMVVVWWW